MLRIGIAIDETWAFFKEVEEELSSHHQTSHFKPRTINLPIFNERVNRYLLHKDWESFLRSNEVVFFEWASGLLEAATRFPKTGAIVTRLHRYEMYRWADKIHWDAVDRIILVSRAKQREFSRRFPTQTEKIVVIPEAISLDRFKSVSKPFHGDIGILCHLSPRKRVYELILAFYELTHLRSNFHLHIGGGPHSNFPDYADTLYSLVERLGLQHKVTFYGAITDPQDWYHQIDILISNSYSEGLQVSPMEAIACGCYCISHNWDGADEFFPAANLFYSEAELIQSILEYSEISQSEKLRRIAGMQETVRSNHDVDKIKVQIREVVEAAAAGYTSGRVG